MKIKAHKTLLAFLHSEAAGGVILMGVAALALAIANSPLAGLYFHTLHLPLGPLPVLEWINDGLMALFFLLVGLEIKREMIGGQLASWAQRALPGIAAAGGMAVPALIYLVVQRGDGQTLHGWAIPAATDIAFALGVITLLGSRVPVSLKVFLTALAILDDLGAVLIIAFFYAGDLHLWALGGVAVAAVVLLALNRLRVAGLWAYLGVGAVLWVCMLKSGVHATLAGVLLALFIPITAKGDARPLETLEHALAPWVAFLIVPLFGFANAGVALGGVGLSALTSPIPLGVGLGLFFGKQIGVFGSAFIAIKLRVAQLPHGASWRQLYGTAVLCGIGFTMSLFIGLLAFADPAQQDLTKIGVLAGSIASAVLGWIILSTAAKRG
ncbi:MAG TPA: Na+/H+ antiporter NhaA [Rhizomicrobium sp.]|nr:Na+/H+ antiporter NhaA [Rhizomicrobium sp.]